MADLSASHCCSTLASAETKKSSGETLLEFVFFVWVLEGFDVELLLAGLWMSTMFGSKVNVHD